MLNHSYYPRFILPQRISWLPFTLQYLQFSDSLIQFMDQYWLLLKKGSTHYPLLYQFQRFKISLTLVQFFGYK